MAQFPRTEAEILALAESIKKGLADSAEVYDAPPVSADDLTTLITGFTDKRAIANKEAAEAAAATADKDDALSELEGGMKSVLRYAEEKVKGDDAKLQLLGWGGRAAPKSSQAPGQPRQLEIVEQGPDWIELDWKKPADGGRVLAYRVQRREKDGKWANVDMALESEATLSAQPTGVTLEYQVIAENKSGKSAASNVVQAVL